MTLGNGTQIANASAVRAIFALIDIRTGIVTTDGCDYDGNYYLVHPETGVKIRGIQIPFWQECLTLVRRAAERLPSIRHIGWDVAITERGPILIEGNHDPGYTAYQLPLLTGKHKGILPIYKMYLKK